IASRITAFGGGSVGGDAALALQTSAAEAGPREGAAPVERTALSQPTPNPVSHEAAFTLDLVRPARVGVEVLDLLGRSVWSESPRWIDAGRSTLRWSGVDFGGRRVANGLYVVRVTIDGR